MILNQLALRTLTVGGAGSVELVLGIAIGLLSIEHHSVDLVV